MSSRVLMVVELVVVAVAVVVDVVLEAVEDVEVEVAVEVAVDVAVDVAVAEEVDVEASVALLVDVVAVDVVATAGAARRQCCSLPPEEQGSNQSAFLAAARHMAPAPRRCETRPEEASKSQRCFGEGSPFVTQSHTCKYLPPLSKQRRFPSSPVVIRPSGEYLKNCCRRSGLQGRTSTIMLPQSKHMPVSPF
mmetsp:Transcript_53100/g.154504  ORF Transcript_53100/g.154504 Transcript_53100/m.154504 type:complete len:192 (-) Transcript_53100:314-889(-)